MSCKSCCSDTSTGRIDFQYAVKIACGVLKAGDKLVGNPLPPGQYFTAINIHNPSRCDSVTFRWKVAVGLPGLRVGTVSAFAEATLGPDEALEIDCPDVMKMLAKPGGSAPEFVKGWVVIETPDQLDVVAVYGAAQASGQPLNVFHTERVQPRCLPACEDFGLNISTGVAAWEVALPGSTAFAPATLSSGNSAWTNLPGALWLRPGTTQTIGDYTYRLAFQLCSGFKNPSINLQVLADNWAVVSLNGQSIGTTTPTLGSTNPFKVPALISATGPFKAGRNELTVVVTNQGDITGLALEGIIDADQGRCPGVPLPLLACPGVCYRLHMRNIGWGDWACNGATAGTTGQNRRAEAVEIYLTGAPPGTTIEYQGHLENLGWTAWTPEGQTCGTTGQNRRMEAVKVRLVNAPLNCRVRYRVHMKNLGWSNWAYDGQQAGTTGQNRRMEAIEIVIE